MAAVETITSKKGETDMRSIKAWFVVATTDVDLEGQQFTEGCLKHMVKKAELPLRVLWEFDEEKVVGMMTKLWLIEGHVIGAVEITKLAVVSGFKYDPADPDAVEIVEGRPTTFKKVEVMNFGLTTEPVDPHCGITYAFTEYVPPEAPGADGEEDTNGDD